MTKRTPTVSEILEAAGPDDDRMRKYPYPKRPITLTAEVKIDKRLTGRIKRKVINRTTELAGIVPFDWMMHGRTFVAFFGFVTMESALAAQARLQHSNFRANLMTEDEENQIFGQFLRQAEAEGHEILLREDNVEIDWKNDPAFAEKKSN
jgi:hypothetical protein